MPTKIRTPKATAQLREDHRKVRKLFSEYEKLEDAEEKKAELFQKVLKELTVHAQIEEEIFYPAMEAVDDEDVQELLKEAHEEHKVAKTLLAELSEMTPADDTFDAKMTVLIENVRHHAQEEEESLFPHFDELPQEQQDDVAERLRSRKGELTQE